MDTLILDVRGDAFFKLTEKASDIIRKGGLVAFPTETVYGLGADGMNENSSKKIYEAKKRPSDNPLILHISDMSQLDIIAKNIPAQAYSLMEKYWPGPLTLILEKKDAVPLTVTGGLSSVAVRMPANDIARNLIRLSDTPIAAPSANLSGRPSPTSFSHVYEDMNGRIDAIINGGDVPIGIESTIIDMTCKNPVILRPGFITCDMIADVLGEGFSECSSNTPLPDEAKPKAPGMKYRHYAPKAYMEIVRGEEKKVARYILDRYNTLSKDHDSGRIAVLCGSKTAKLYGNINCYILGDGELSEDIASNLFRVLRKLDEDGIEIAFSESFEKGKFKDAVMNRLIKAAGQRITDV